MVLQQSVILLSFPRPPLTPDRTDCCLCTST